MIMMRCGVITLFACVLFPLVLTQNSTLTTEKNAENTTTKPIPENKTIQLEPFLQLAHGLRSGPITIINNQTFLIPDLFYDGLGPDAHFWAGNGSEPSSSGILVPDENGSNKSLSAYNGQNITIKLPNNLTIDQIDYLGVWCIQFNHNFGHVLTPKGRTRQIDVPKPKLEPLGIQLEPFKQLAHGLRSGPIVVIDKKTFFIPNLHYDGKGPDAHFWVGNGSEPSPTGVLVPDENGSVKSISAYTGHNIYITLPGELTIDKIDYLGVWCIQYKHNFGHVIIPKGKKIPEPHGNPRKTDDAKTIIPIQKCCPLNQVLSTSGCENANQDFDPEINVHVHNSTHIDDEPLRAETFRFEPFVNHINCEHNQYPLFPEEDKFALLQNGSLMVLNTQKFLSQDNYCIETVDFGDAQESYWITTAIICFSSGDVPKSNTIFVIYAVGIMVSALFLVITALVFILVKEVRDARGKCVIFYSLSMAAAFICLGSAQFSGIDDKTCNTVGFIIQFFLVSSFTWLTMVSWETYYKIRKHSSDAYTKDRKRLFIYIGIGVLVPLVTLMICLFADQIPGIPSSFLKPHFGRNSCWFDQKQDTMLYFYVPIGVAIFFNIVLAILMKWNLVWFQKHRKGDVSWITIKMELKPMFRSCLFLLSVMTLCWVMEIISFLVQSEGGVWVAIDIINSLQGLIVFVIFVLHRPVKDKICKIREIRLRSKTPEEKPIKLLNMNGSANTNHNNHNDFLTNLRHADSVEDLT